MLSQLWNRLIDVDTRRKKIKSVVKKFVCDLMRIAKCDSTKYVDAV